MKVLIVSDTHGRDENLERAVMMETPFDMLVHCGDVEGREIFIEALVDCPCCIVSGNNDFFSDLPREEEIDIDGNKVELTEEDLLIETAQTEGYVTESEGETAVVLDTNLTPELIEEGFVREIISKVQTMRKEAGFEVMDKIRVSVKDNDKIIETMKANEAEIKSEVLAEEVVYGETDGYVKEWNINKEHVTLGVTKL